MKPFIQTATGRLFDFSAPRAEDVNIADIAHALALNCRYNGHTHYDSLPVLYSVGEHACHVHDLVSPPARKHALLHDATEAYMPDVSAPLKAYLRSIGCTVIDELEANIWGVIVEAFDIELYDAEVHEVDKRLIGDEAIDLMHPVHDDWFLPLGYGIDVTDPWPPKRTVWEFMHRWEKLCDH